VDASTFGVVIGLEGAEVDRGPSRVPLIGCS
jgi:hypothetical protein